MSFTPYHLYYEDLEVGQEWRSLGRTITEADIVNFAGLSGDFNPIHVDHEYAKGTPFRGPIAHGLLVFAIGTGLGISAPLVRTVALLNIKDWTFKDAVFPGDTIHVVSKVLEKQLRGRGKRGEVTWQRQFFNQSGKVVMEGITMTLIEARGPKAATATESVPAPTLPQGES